MYGNGPGQRGDGGQMTGGRRCGALADYNFGIEVLPQA
jgi:hypothetical protein